jgi:hypothetical protein
MTKIPGVRSHRRDSHYPVSATSGETSSMDPSIIQILDYKHADWTKYKHFLTDNVPQITPTRDPDEIDRQIDQLTTTINTAKELAIKIKNIPKNKRPLLPRILNLLKLKRKLFRSRQEKLAALNI